MRRAGARAACGRLAETGPAAAQPRGDQARGHDGDHEHRQHADDCQSGSQDQHGLYAQPPQPSLQPGRAPRAVRPAADTSRAAPTGSGAHPWSGDAAAGRSDEFIARPPQHAAGSSVSVQLAIGNDSGAWFAGPKSLSTGKSDPAGGTSAARSSAKSVSRDLCAVRQVKLWADEGSFTIALASSPPKART